MKTTVKVFAYNELIYAGTLDGAVKSAQKVNKKYNCNVAIMEIWNKDEDYYLQTVPEFWY